MDRMISGRPALSGRVAAMVALLTLEALAATLLFDGDRPVPDGAWLATAIHVWGASIARFAIAFSVIFATFAFLRHGSALHSIESPEEPIRYSVLGAHIAATVTFFATSRVVYGGRDVPLDANLAGAIWLLSALSFVLTAAVAFIPRSVWTELFRTTGPLWLYAGIAAATTIWAGHLFRSLWTPTSRLTFRLVSVFLTPFAENLVLQPDNMRLGTGNFTVVIAKECSGLEGIGLILAFVALWLLIFRRETRFPQALILFPIGVGSLFLLNAVRITALILIGDAGARAIATGGFHSQAGWIAFNSVALGSCVLARRWSWITTRSSDQAPRTAEHEETAAYLAPFLALLGAGLLIRVLTVTFEWLYPLRVIAAAAALWFCRRSYAGLNWRFSWAAPLTGVAVFLVWIAFDWMDNVAVAAMPPALAAAPFAMRTAWIAIRIIGGIVAVPLAEELAFRGYLMRRFCSVEFATFDFRETGWFAVLGSSVLFGMMHGSRWPAAIVAGAAYAITLRATGRMGDAVAAHAITNVLIAVAVLSFGQWQLW